MRERTTFLAIVLVSLAAACLALGACATDFTSPDGTGDADTDTHVDTGGDTPVDTHTDGEPDSGTDPFADTSSDVPLDTEPDVITTWNAMCQDTGDSQYVLFPDAAGFDWGCGTEGCSHVGLWIDVVGGVLMAVAVREDSATMPVSRVAYAWMIDPGDLSTIASMEILPDDMAVSWHRDVTGGSVVQDEDGTLSVIMPVNRYDGGSTPTEQNLRVISVWPDAGMIGVSQHDLLGGVMPTADDGRLTQARALRTPWGDYDVFAMMEEDGPIFMVNQLYGAAISGDDFTDPTFTVGFAARFKPLEPSRSTAHIPALPGYFMGAVVMPFMELDMVVDLGAYHAGLWIMPDDMTPGSPGTSEPMPFDSTCAFEAMPGGATIAAGVSYGMAVLCGESRFSAAGIAPPLWVDSGIVAAPTPGMPVNGFRIKEAAGGPFRDMEYVSFAATKVMYDPMLGAHHYSTVTYPDAGNGTVEIYTFREDGALANPDSYSYQHDTGAFVLPAVDVTLDQGSSQIFIANFTYPTGGAGWLDGFYLTRVACLRAEY